MIRLEHVSFSYEADKPVLNDVSLEIPRGGRICLFGPSGEGKTTILRMILGLEQPESGRVLVDSSLRMSAVFQEDRLLDWRTVKENLTLFMEEEKATFLLKELGMEAFADVRPGELSGGQRRRVALARALGHESDVLVLDEPLTGLDEENEQRCLEVIERNLKGRTLILVTHELRQADALGAKLIECTAPKTER